MIAHIRDNWGSERRLWSGSSSLAVVQASQVSFISKLKAEDSKDQRCIVGRRRCPCVEGPIPTF